MTTSPLKVEEGRAQFEAEFRKQYSFDKHLDLLLEMYNHGTDEEPDIDYYSLAARDAWKWWQASRAAIVVELPEPHAHLIWIQAGRAPDDYWDDVEVSRSEQDKCCDGSDRYAVYAEHEVAEMLAGAGITVKGD